MLCCAGLFVGFLIGQVLGGPWMLIAPAIGFVLGLVGDRRIMMRHGGGDESAGEKSGRHGCCGL